MRSAVGGDAVTFTAAMASPSRQIPRKGHPDDDVKAAAADEGVWKHVPSYDNLAAMLPGEETGVLKTTLRRSFTTVKTTLQRIFNSSDRWSGKTSSNGSANLQPQSAPVPVPPPTPNKGSGDPEAIRRHDLFNITCTGFIVAIVYSYLFIATEYAKLGTPALGVEYFWLSRVLLYTLIAYLAVDTAWIFVQPSCVLGGAPALIAHHVATLLFCVVPLTEPRYAWHLSVTLAVEINTFALVARRNVPLGSPAYRVLNALFYASWALFRLFVFPALTLMYYAEYIEYTYDPTGGDGSFLNKVLLAPLLQGTLTLLSFKWTYDMLAKMGKKAGTSDKGKKD